MSDAARARRLADRIREIVAEVLERQVKDPRLGFVTVTDARVTPDLRDATVYYTVLGDEADRERSAVALRSATGVVRSEVGRRTGVKFTPTVSFVADVVPEHARVIDDLLARARAADEQVQRVAEGARPAGDPDPYRVPRAADDTGNAADTDGADARMRSAAGAPADGALGTTPGTVLDEATAAAHPARSAGGDEYGGRGAPAAES